jgi:hypothetical protein
MMSPPKQNKSMTRRSMLATTAGAAALTAGAQPRNPATVSKPAFFELKRYQMRNSKSNQVGRTSTFISQVYAPAARRAGIGPIGVFSAVIAPESPFLLVVSSYPSLAEMQTAMEKLASDPEYVKGLAEFDANPDLPYVRIENTLLRCFDTFPTVEKGKTPATGSRIFELRTYESDNETTVKRKIRMFADGELAIFRRCGLQPVFFGEALAGANLPRITYMVAYENMADREKAWAAFGSDPEWQKLKVTPGMTDPDIVSNISNAILKPAAGSDIR